MNCPFCGCSSGVLETRMRKSGTLRRTRVCNGLRGQAHKFTTEEIVYMGTLGRARSKVPAPHRMLTQAERRKAVKYQLQAGTPAQKIVENTGASLRTVQRVKAHLSEVQP